MRFIATGLALTGAVVALAGLTACATPPPRPTLTVEQCVSTDWAALGYADGLAGHGGNRIQRHITACAESGVTPDAEVYHARMLDGQRAYCTPARGFRVASGGGGYTNGWCAADLEPAFLGGFADGVIVQQSYQATVTADARLAEARQLIVQIGYDATDAERRLAVEGITEAEADSLRQRLRNLRAERETAQRAIRDLEWAVDEARRVYAETRSRFIPTYGTF